MFLKIWTVQVFYIKMESLSHGKFFMSRFPVSDLYSHKRQYETTLSVYGRNGTHHHMTVLFLKNTEPPWFPKSGVYFKQMEHAPFL